MGVITLIFADDHPLVVKGFIALFEASRDFRILCACEDGTQALQAIKDLRPDVAVLDKHMPTLSGLDVLKETVRQDLTTRILLLSGAPQRNDILDALAEGAYGYLAKDSPPDELLDAVRRAASNQKTFPFDLFSIVDAAQVGPSQKSVQEILTQSEWKVMALAVQGLSNKEIATELEITSGTVKIHLYRIFQKLGVTNRTSLASLSFRSSAASTN